MIFFLNSIEDYYNFYLMLLFFNMHLESYVLVVKIVISYVPKV
jgi:hypothetical protein